MGLGGANGSLQDGGLSVTADLPLAVRGGEWVLARGVPYVLTQAPMIALLVGFLFRWTSYPIATAFSVLPGFVLLPVWLAWRFPRARDPEEPARRFYAFAAWSVVPVVIFDLARVPLRPLFGVVFWSSWFDFGSNLTGSPPLSWRAWAAGTLLHCLQGYVLALGFYILFKRRSFGQALVYVWVLLSVIYIWTFRVFTPVNFRPPLSWYLTVIWAHFCMAIAVWGMPRLGSWSPWRRLSKRAVAPVALAAVVVAALPFALVGRWVNTWQLPQERALEQRMLATGNLVRIQHGPSPVTSSESGSGPPTTGETDYDILLRVGPLNYRDASKTSRAFQVTNVVVRGRLVNDGQVVAECFAENGPLPSPSALHRASQYRRALATRDFDTISVDCRGATVRDARPSALTDQWQAVLSVNGQAVHKLLTYAYDGTRIHLT